MTRRFDHQLAADMYANEPEMSLRDVREVRARVKAERERAMAPRCGVCQGPNVRGLRQSDPRYWAPRVELRETV
jgi:hypothetical protein